jgi:hypothetical protein
VDHMNADRWIGLAGIAVSLAIAFWQWDGAKRQGEKVYFSCMRLGVGRSLQLRKSARSAT